MRLVWAVIPLLLIGIAGVQESFSSCLQVPCFDETTVAWYEHIPHEPFELKKIKGASFGSEHISFRLLGVEDSRCPSDVQCVWEGQVTVNVDVNAGWENIGNYTISLNESLDGLLIQLDGYSLELIKVEPYPVSTDSIHVSDYVATMKFSMTEIPESVISESVSSPISGEMSLSNIPKLGEDAQLTITQHIVTRSYGYPTIGIGLVIPPGFELIDAGNLIFNEENTELLQRDKAYENIQVFSKEIPVSDSDEIQTMTSVVTIKAVQTGNWTLHATSSLNVVVGEDESFLVDYFQSPSVPYSSTEPEPPPKLINIHPSPKKQLESGVTPENVICREGLQLIFKQNNSPSCVTPSTAEKLIQRGWTR